MVLITPLSSTAPVPRLTHRQSIRRRLKPSSAAQVRTGQFTVDMRACSLMRPRGASGAILSLSPPRAQTFAVSNRADQRDGHGRQRRHPHPTRQSVFVLENFLRNAVGCGRGDDVCVGIFGRRRLEIAFCGKTRREVRVGRCSRYDDSSIVVSGSVLSNFTHCDNIF